MIEEKIPHLEKAIEWAERKGFTEIKANTDDYETPKAYIQKNGEDEDAFIPDISVQKWGVKSFVEIALKTENERRRVSKWKLLSTLAAMKRGKLYLLAPRGHRRFADDLVKKYQISANIVTI